MFERDLELRAELIKIPVGVARSIRALAPSANHGQQSQSSVERRESKITIENAQSQSDARRLALAFAWGDGAAARARTSGGAGTHRSKLMAKANKNNEHKKSINNARRLPIQRKVNDARPRRCSRAHNCISNAIVRLAPEELASREASENVTRTGRGRRRTRTPGQFNGQQRRTQTKQLFGSPTFARSRATRARGPTEFGRNGATIGAQSRRRAEQVGRCRRSMRVAVERVFGARGLATFTPTGRRQFN